MPNNQSQNQDRWQALDVMKTLGLLGAITGHILIWWFGTNLDAKVGDVFFSLSGIPNWLVVFYLIAVHFILISAGAAFYFYLKHRPTLKKIILRITLLIILGVLFGLNLHPPILFWNVFLFYALSVLIVYILNRCGSIKAIIYLTFGVIISTPFIRFFLSEIFPENYFIAILIGDSGGQISFYPLFPWFFLVGVGFLTSYYYLQYQSKRLLNYGLYGGLIISFSTIPFLKPLDLSNVFGITSQISIFYIILIFSSFVFTISLLEMILKKITFSKYNPIVAIGRHILPIYLIAIILTLPLESFLKKSVKYRNGTYTFFILELITLAIACLSGIILTYPSSKRER